MEIAHDFATHGATMTISVRSPVNIVNKELVYLGIMAKLKFLPMEFVDRKIGFLAWFKFGDLSNYGFVRPNLGTSTDGAVEKIRDGVIQVQPSISNSVGSEVNFSIGQALHFETIVFATGYRSTANTWLKHGGDMLTTDRLPVEIKERMAPIPHQWTEHCAYGKNM